MPAIPPKFSFDSEEVSGICPPGKDAVFKAEDEREADGRSLGKGGAPVGTEPQPPPLDTSPIQQPTLSRGSPGQASRRSDLSFRRAGSAPSGSAPSGSRVARPTAALAPARIGSAPPRTGSSHPEPPEIVVSEFSALASLSFQTALPTDGAVCVEFPAVITDDGAVCVDFTAILNLDSGEKPVPMLPKCPVPPAKECIESHKLEIHPIYVYMALNDFVAKFHNNELADIKSIARIMSRKRNTISRMLSSDDVTHFWECYRNAFPEERRRLWDGFLKGLNKYYQVLSQRHKLNMEAMSLKRQNEELRQLLANYIEYNEKMKHKNGTTLPPLR